MKLKPISRKFYTLFATPLLIIITLATYLLIGVAMSDGPDSAGYLVAASLIASYFIYVYLALRRAKDMELPLLIPLLYFTFGIPTGLISMLPIIHIVLCVVPGMDRKNTSR